MRRDRRALRPEHFGACSGCCHVRYHVQYQSHGDLPPTPRAPAGPRPHPGRVCGTRWGTPGHGEPAGERPRQCDRFSGAREAGGPAGGGTGVSALADAGCGFRAAASSNTGQRLTPCASNSAGTACFGEPGATERPPNSGGRLVINHVAQWGWSPKATENRPDSLSSGTTQILDGRPGGETETSSGLKQPNGIRR